MTNWKTTVNGILAGIIGSIGPLTAYLATQNNPTATKISGAVTVAGIIARVWIGVLQNDAPPTPPNLSSNVKGN